MRYLLLIALSVALAFGCGKKDTDKTDKAPQGKKVDKPDTPKSADTPKPTEPVAAADDALPTSVDFEEEADEAINEKNLEEELSKLEKELED